MDRWIVAVEFTPRTYRGPEWYWEVTRDGEQPITVAAGRSPNMDDMADDVTAAIDADLGALTDDRLSQISI